MVSEIEELQAKLALKQEELNAINEVVSACDVRISAVRSKFDAPLQRIAADKARHEQESRNLNEDAEKLALRKVKCHAAHKKWEEKRDACRKAIDTTDTRMREAEQWRSRVEAHLRRRKYWADLKTQPRKVRNDALKAHEAAVKKSATTREELATKETSAEATKQYVFFILFTREIQFSY